MVRGTRRELLRIGARPKIGPLISVSPGSKLAHYKILEKIGSGGMGDVYLAEDTKLDRKVALKVLPPELAESDERRLGSSEKRRPSRRSITPTSSPSIRSKKQKACTS